MRSTAITGLILLIAPWAIAPASGQSPATAPDAEARIGQSLAHLFELPYDEQHLVRQQLENQPDLPALLASLLCHSDPAVRRTSLMLLRDGYGDWSAVPAVQALLSSELSRGADGDGYLVAACCEILSDLPRWDSVPVLLNALKTDRQVDNQAIGAGSGAKGLVSVWRKVDSALRLVSGEWPIPEPEMTGPKAPAAGSPGDRGEQQTLHKTWGDWWASSVSMADPLPQVRLEFTWADATTPRAARTGDNEAVASMLWVRPTGSARYVRIAGLSAGAADPAWRWDDRTRREYEFHLNAIQADAARALASAVAVASSGTWSVARPPGATESWRGRLQIIAPDGQTVAVDLADMNTPGAVRPPMAAVEALAELLTLTTAP